MDRMEVIQRILDSGRRDTYLEIGVERGFSFMPIRAKRKIAVDPNFRRLNVIKLVSSFTGGQNLYFEMISDEFFEHHADVIGDSGIDVAFIDGLHTYNQSSRDVENSLRFLNKNGVIVMHDCNPSTRQMEYPAASYEQAVREHPPEWDRLWCGDVWKAIANLRATRSDLEVCVLDCDFGVGLIRRSTPQNRYDVPAKGLENMTYKDLERDRAAILNLREPNYLQIFLNAPSQRTFPSFKNTVGVMMAYALRKTA